MEGYLKTMEKELKAQLLAKTARHVAEILLDEEEGLERKAENLRALADRLRDEA